MCSRFSEDQTYTHNAEGSQTSYGQTRDQNITKLDREAHSRRSSSKSASRSYKPALAAAASHGNRKRNQHRRDRGSPKPNPFPVYNDELADLYKEARAHAARIKSQFRGGNNPISVYDEEF